MASAASKRIFAYHHGPFAFLNTQPLCRKLLNTQNSPPLRGQLSTMSKDFSLDIHASTPLMQLHRLLYPKNRIDFGPFERQFHCPFLSCPEQSPCAPDKPSIYHVQDIRGMGEGFVLRFLLRPDRWTGEQLKTLKIGFTTHYALPERTCDRGLWREGRVSTVRQAVAVEVCVLLPEALCDAEHMEDHAYWEVKKSADGTIMLGEMVDFLEVIRGRSGEEHMRRSKEVDEDMMMDFDMDDAPGTTGTRQLLGF